MSLFEIVSSVPWQPEIGDPTLFGWLTVLAYTAAAAACAVCAWRAEDIFGAKHGWQHRLIWGGLAAALLFLGINKQLDLQSWFTAVIKTLAYEQGWYALGQRAQIYFIAGLGMVSLFVMAMITWQMRGLWRHYWLLLLGFLFLARFVIVRAASFYGVPLPQLSQLTGGFRITPFLEILGACCITLAALLNLRIATRQPVRQRRT